MPTLEVKAVSKSFGPAPVLRDVSFHVDEGETVCLLGPSGCGKTTLLRIIAGLEIADSGQIHLEGRPVAGVPVHRRGIGLMFQDYALFPHKDVAANVAFGLRMQRHELRTRAQVRARVREMLDLVGLAGAGRRRVYDLSGGEQQRVALARSLAPRPRLLMLDEPLGSLDRALREQLMGELRTILHRLRVTAVYVTHDQAEAFAMADRILIMNQGRILQAGTPEAVYRQPATTWIARFLGHTNLVPGLVAGAAPADIVTQLGPIPVAACTGGEPPPPLLPGQAVTVLIRPEAARLATGDAGPLTAPLHLEGTVQECAFRGGHYHLALRHASGLELAFQLVAGAASLPRAGDDISLALDGDAVSLLPSPSPSGRGLG